MQHAKTILLEQIVRKTAVKRVLGQTITATTSMDPVFSDVMMDIKEKDAKIVINVELINDINFDPTLLFFFLKFIF